MESIKLVNIRSLVDSGPVRIAPITVLVGQNSSGKSTFVRFFPLLRQSAEVLAREPILWFGRFVDFGSAEDAASRIGATGNPGFDVTFEMDSTALVYRRRVLVAPRVPNIKRSTTVTVSVRYLSVQADKKQFEFKFTFLEYEVIAQINDVGVSALKINGTDYSEHTQGKLYASAWSACFPNLFFRDENSPDFDPFTKAIANYVRTHTHGKSQQDRIAFLTRSVLQVPLDEVLENLKNPPGADSTWQKNTSHWTADNKEFQRIRNWIVGARLVEIIQAASSTFSTLCSQVRYITPIRASAERYYRRQGLALGEIDPQGQNVAMFLHNLSATEKQRFTAWMSEYFEYSVDTVATSGHISMVIRDGTGTDAATSINLADTGFGLSQMIPVLMQIWILANRRPLRGASIRTTVIAIEQPELHLHPRLQAVLADLFLQAVRLARENGVDLRLVIETHSEQIINRLGRRVGESKFDSNDVSVVLFDKSAFSLPTQVKVAGFDKDGFITNWPYGFFETTD